MDARLTDDIKATLLLAHKVSNGNATVAELEEMIATLKLDEQRIAIAIIRAMAEDRKLTKICEACEEAGA